MRISEDTLGNLSKAVIGEIDGFIYLTGTKIIHYFNQFGYSETSLGIFSRNGYAEHKLRELNGTDAIRQIIEDTVAPSRFYSYESNYHEAAMILNSFIRYDGLELRKVGEKYKLFDLHESLVNPEVLSELDHSFINEQIRKSQEKIASEDYHGAITNARTLVEALLIDIIEKHTEVEIKNDGNLEGLWTQVKKILNLELGKEQIPDYVKQILSGIDTAIKGFAGLSNNMGDRHATKLRARKHHAKLAVNLAITIGEFLLDSMQYQKEKVCISTQQVA